MGALDKYFPTGTRANPLSKYGPTSDPAELSVTKPTLSVFRFDNPIKTLEKPKPDPSSRRTEISQARPQTALEKAFSTKRVADFERQRTIDFNRKNSKNLYSGSNLALDAFAQGILPIRPKELIPKNLKESFPFATGAGKLVGLALASTATAGIVPALQGKLAAGQVGGAIAKAIPAGAALKAGVGMQLNISPMSQFFIRALPRMAQRAALWGGKEILDQTARVIAGGEDPTVEGLVAKPLEEATFGALSGVASGIGKTGSRIMGQAAMRGAWVGGKALMDDGIIDKNDMLNIGINMAIGGAVEAFNAKAISRSFKLDEQKRWDKAYWIARVKSRNPKMSQAQAEESALKLEMWATWDIKRPAMVRVAKQIAQRERVLKDMGIRPATGNVNKIAQAKGFANKMVNDLTASSKGAPVIPQQTKGITANILKTFQVPKGTLELETRPTFGVQSTAMIPDGKGGYSLETREFAAQTELSPEREASLEAEAQSAFDELLIPDMNWGNLPADYKRAIRDHVSVNGKNEIEPFMEQLFSQYIVSAIGGIGKEKEVGSDSPVFFGTRSIWGKNPSTDIRSAVSDVIQAGVTPTEIVIQGTQAGDSERIAKVFREEYAKQLHKVEAEETVKELTQLSNAQKRLRRAERQEPSDIEDAQEAVLEARIAVEAADFSPQQKEEILREARKTQTEEEVPQFQELVATQTKELTEDEKLSGQRSVPKAALPEVISESIETQDLTKKEVVVEEGVIREKMSVSEIQIVEAKERFDQAFQQEDVENMGEAERQMEEYGEVLDENGNWTEVRSQVPDGQLGYSDVILRAKTLIANLQRQLAAKDDESEKKAISRELLEARKFLSQASAIENTIYTVQPLAPGQLALGIQPLVTLNKNFLTLPDTQSVYDAETGEQRELPDGYYALHNIGDGLVRIVDGISPVVVHLDQLNAIQLAGGDFVDINPAAGGLGIFNSSQGGLFHSFDGKKIVADSLPGFKEPSFRLKVILKSMRMFGMDTDRSMDMLGKWTKGMLNTIQDPATAQKVVKEIAEERHINKYGRLLGGRLEDDIRQYIRGIVEKDIQASGVTVTEQGVVKAINDWSYILQHAGAEIISMSNKSYSRSDQGFQLSFQPGIIPGHPDSERFAVEQAYQRVTGQLEMPDKSLSSLGIEPNAADTALMVNNTRPELLFFNLLKPELQKLLIYVKHEYETVHFNDMRQSGVMDRADITSLILRGYSNRHFTFDDIQVREGYYGGRALSSKNLPHAKYRTYAEFELAAGQGQIGAGLIPIVDFAATMGEYVRDAVARTQQVNMIRTLKDIPNENMSLKGVQPLNLITNLNNAAQYMKLDPIKDKERVSAWLTKNAYSEIKLPALVEYFRGGFQSAWARNDLHEIIKESYTPTQSPGWVKGLIKLNGVVKRTILFSPYQYFLQVGSSPALHLGWRGSWELYVKPIIRFDALWKPTANRIRNTISAQKRGLNIKYGITQHLSEWDHITKESTYDPILFDAFMREGLSSFDLTQTLSSLYDSKDLTGHPDSRTVIEGAIEFISGKGGIDRQVFNHIVGKMMYHFAEAKYKSLVKDNASHEDAVRLAVDFANTTSGLLDNVRWAGQPKDMYQLVLFARDFTFSFMKQVSGATYPLWSKTHKFRTKDLAGMNTLLHTDKDTKDMNRMWSYYLTHLMRVVFFRMLMASMVQYAIIRHYLNTTDDQDGRTTEEHQWAWMNWKDPGKIGMIVTPWFDPTGRRIYIDPLLFREMYQMTQLLPPLGGNIGNFIKNKTSFTLNAILKILTQMDFMNRPITDKSGLVVPWGDRVLDVVKSLGEDALPTFIRDSPRVSPAFNSVQAVGITLKRSRFPFGPGETLEESREIKKEVARVEYFKSRNQKVSAEATLEELEALLDEYVETGGERGISPAAYENALKTFLAPVASLEKKYATQIEKFKKRKR